MDIQQMHNVFRTLGQQMGIQLIRGILPESIDVFINDAILEKVRRDLLNSVEISLKDNVDGKGSTMSLINVFGDLYKRNRYSVTSENLNKVNSTNGYHIINIPFDYMMVLGTSIEYDESSEGNATNCRLINLDELYSTLHDYCNTASKEYPIACINNRKIEVYLNTPISIKYINIFYIKNPNIVKFDIDISKCINCDLPDYTHYEIIELAVQKFNKSVGAIQPNQARQ